MELEFFFIIVLCLTMHLVHAVELGFLESAHSVQNVQGICGQFVWPRGYDCEEFMVPTEDGFLLSMQRMYKAGVTNPEVKDPVFLYHGLMQGGEAWVLNEPYESLSFMLADSGYQVWIGSTRSSTFSYGHKTYKRSDQEFWDWRWDDLVSYDLPAMLQFVNSETAKPILYVGYSQGSMSGFAAFTNGGIASLVKKAAMLSPVAYLNHVSAPLSTVSTALFLDQWDLALHIYEFNISVARDNHMLDMVCQNAYLGITSCYDGLLTLQTGPNCCINKTKEAYYSRYETQSTATKNLVQLAQLMRTGRFCKYDYDLFGNIEKYGTIIPPSYKLERIPKSLPFLLVYGGSDPLADKVDVEHVASELPGNVEMVFMEDYAHLDMILGTSAHVDVYPRVIKFFQQQTK